MELPNLNLPLFSFKTRKSENRIEIFDAFRKKWVVLTPEEWVRQNFLTWLVESKGYPVSLIALERGLTVNKKERRFDAVVFNTNGNVLMLLEFKSPYVKLSAKTIDQIAAYNTVIKAKYLTISNGILHYCAEINYDDNSYSFLNNIPLYNK
jgi:hypothetical protein